ncbi:MAG TPA: hypothetical protein P5564_07600, partial [Paludibacteraceae bacterium]|nr:hypothetical protein [Paludibacteraceae bacterium]
NGNLDEIAADSVNSDGTPITDNGIFEEGATVPSFKITLKDIGFDINDYLSANTATISMKNGLCGGREFEILSCVKEGNKYILTCNRVLDEGIGLYFPYAPMNIKAGDKFVLLNIEMPDVYIEAASQRLLAAGQEYLSKNDYVRYTYEVNISPVYMARNPILHDTIVEGDYLQFADTDLGIAGSVIIDNLRIKEGDEIIPTYKVTLTEEKQVGTIQKIQNQINYLLSGAGGSILDVKQTESLIRLIGDRQFLSKVSEDTAQKLIKFLEGIEVGTFASGLLGSGAAIKNVNGTSVAEVDQLLVRQRAEFFSVLIHEARSVGGQLIISAANMLCTKVEETPNFYRCYFDSKDGEVANLFSNTDFARCQIFTGTRQKFYWRKVVAVGTDYIELSKTDAALNSDIPEVGDTIFQLGSTDVNRQGAMILSTVGNDAPSFIQYSGINSYDLTGKETTKFTRLGNRIVGNTVFLSGGQNLEEWADETSQNIKDKNKTFFAKPSSYVKGDTWFLLEDAVVGDIPYKKGTMLKAVYETGTEYDWRLVFEEDQTTTTDGINLIRNYDLRYGFSLWGGDGEFGDFTDEEYDALPTEFYTKKINVVGDEYGFNMAITSEDNDLIIWNE